MAKKGTCSKKISCNYSICLMVAVTLSLFDCAGDHVKGKYINLEPGPMNPEVFAPNFISMDSSYEYGSVFSADGYEMYFGIDLGHRSEIRMTIFRDGVWSTPKTIISDEKYSFNDPFLSPDENELYYISNQPRNRSHTSEDYDIWFSERSGEAWSDPINAGSKINSDYDEYYVSFTNTKTMYFSSNRTLNADSLRDFNIYSATFTGGQFNDPVALSDSINGSTYEADVYVAPDESFIVFCSVRAEGLGRGDLYYSYRRSDQSWSRPLNMGASINSSGHQLCPFVTHDGQYFFYTSEEDIYWVSFPTLRSSLSEQIL